MTLVMILEAILFASDKPVSISELDRILPDYNPGEIRVALESLQSDYDSMNRSFVLKHVAGGYEFRTKPEYAPYIVNMLRSSPAKLSRAAMETLAIIAYKQPIIRQEIEVIRGVDVGGILRTLLEKNLIKVMGRKNIPGKPLIYGTTSRFLEVFDLEDIKSLPEMKEIKELEPDEDQQDLFRTQERPDKEEQYKAPGETETLRGFPRGEDGEERAAEEKAGGNATITSDDERGEEEGGGAKAENSDED
jgi:segregation and condensation protein B